MNGFARHVVLLLNEAGAATLTDLAREETAFALETLKAVAGEEAALRETVAGARSDEAVLRELAGARSDEAVLRELAARSGARRSAIG